MVARREPVDGNKQSLLRPAEHIERGLQEIDLHLVPLPALVTCDIEGEINERIGRAHCIVDRAHLRLTLEANVTVDNE